MMIFVLSRALNKGKVPMRNRTSDLRNYEFHKRPAYCRISNVTLVARRKTSFPISLPGSRLSYSIYKHHAIDIADPDRNEMKYYAQI